MKSDAQIQQAVLQALMWAPGIDETEIGVEVDHGVVTLTGTVSTATKRQAAQEAAHHVLGVLDVANDIRVKSPADLTPDDTEISQAVRHTLEWYAGVPAQRIQSTVDDGVVTLEGTVDRYPERDAAERAVRDLAGVRSVVNKLELTGPKAEPESVRRSIQEALVHAAERTAKHIELSVQYGNLTVSGLVHSSAERQTVLEAARRAPGVHAVEDQLRVDSYA
jgi:osmotically-inducible protein OsmY